MATIKFKLDGQKIYLHFRQGKKEFKFYTPHKCNPKNWDGDEKKIIKGVAVQIKGKGRVKGNDTISLKINSYLDLIENELKNILFEENVRKSQIGLQADFYAIKNTFFAKYRNNDTYGNQYSKESLIQLFQNYIESRGHLFSKSSLFLLKNVKTQLEAFEKEKSIKTEIDKINTDFIQKFQKFLIDKGHLNATTNLKIKKVKEVINFYKEDYPNIKISKKVKNLPEPEPQRFTMSYDECISFYKYKFNNEKTIKDGAEANVNSKTLECVRDMYVFSFNTGIPYEPLCKLEKSCIHYAEIIEEKIIYKIGNLMFNDSNQMLNYLSQNKIIASGMDISYQKSLVSNRIPIIQYHRDKSKKILVTPLNEICLEIIDKYSGKQNKMLPMMTNQKMNYYIHLALKQSGLFDDEVHYINYRGKETIVKKMPRYEAITFHSARHGFASYLLNSGLPMSFIQKLLGHSDLKTTSIYAKANANDVIKQAFEILK